MFINEVEHIVGLSKKSIRLYEDEGLLHPKRHPNNDYRIYNEDDIKRLKIIKFLRELDVPIKELKELTLSTLTLEECIQNRIDKISNQEEKLKKIKKMCEEIIDTGATYENFEITKYYENMNILKKEGFTLQCVKTRKTNKIIGALISSIIFIAIPTLLLLTVIYFQITEVEKCPLPLFILLIFILILPILGIVINFIARLKEIRGGEEDEASKY